MKRVNYLWMIVMSVFIFFASCSSEDLKVPLQDREGAVFLDGGEYVEAKTEFTESELIERLQGEKWFQSYPYVYDTYDIMKLYTEKGVDGGYWGETFHFSVEGSYSRTEGGVVDAELSYFVNGNKLTMEHNGKMWEFTVVAVDENRIILDLPWNNTLFTVPSDFIDFDRNKAYLRYVWTAVEG